MRRRLIALSLILGLPYLAILARLYSLQIVRETHERYLELSQHQRPQLLEPRRGRILASGGEVLAEGEPVYHVEFRYGDLNPRGRALSILVRVLREDGVLAAGAADDRLVAEEEARLLEIADGAMRPEWIEASAAARPDDDLLLLRDRIPPKTAARLERLLWTYRRLFLVPEADVTQGEKSRGGRGGSGILPQASSEPSFEVWFHVREALRMELTLFRLARALVGPGQSDSTYRARFEELRGRVCRQIETVDTLVKKEVDAYGAGGLDPQDLESKRRDARDAYLRQWWWELERSVPVRVVTEIEYHPELYDGLQILATVRRRYPPGLRPDSPAGCFGTLTGQMSPLQSLLDRAGKPGLYDGLKAGGRILDFFSEADMEDERFPERRKGSLRRRDLVGVSGLEAYYDEDLRGLYGRRIATLDARGHIQKILEEIPPEDGRDIRTTIDLGLQELLYAALAKVIDPYGVGMGGTAGSAAVMDVRTGALLSSVGYPGCDANRPWDEAYAAELARPKAWPATDGYFIDRPSRARLCPGSVFKLVLAAAAMETAGDDPQDRPEERRYECRHEFPGDSAMHCNALGCKETADGKVNLVEAIQYSCNSYFYHLGGMLGAGTIRAWAAAFGYGRPTGIDLPHSKDQDGWLDLPESVTSGRALRHFSIGHVHVLATPLQVLRVVAAIARGDGTLPRPYLVRPYLARTEPSSRSEGPEEPIVPRDPSGRPVGEGIRNRKTFEPIRKGMWLAAHGHNGTAAKAELGLSVYNVSCKTGTAQVKPPEKIYNSWLVGFAPFESPRIAFAVVIEKTGELGADACAPVAAALLEHLDLREPGLYRLGAERGATATSRAAPEGGPPGPQGAGAQEDPAAGGSEESRGIGRSEGDPR